MKSRIMYIENKSDGLVGPARIGRVTFSKTGKTLHYQGRTFQSQLLRRWHRRGVLDFGVEEERRRSTLRKPSPRRDRRRCLGRNIGPRSAACLRQSAKPRSGESAVQESGRNFLVVFRQNPQQRNCVRGSLNGSHRRD